MDKTDRSIGDLAPNPRNPRRITDKKLAMLSRSIKRFGDLSGIVFNRRTKQLVGGHQRVKIFTELKCDVVITKNHEKPTSTGTVAEGYVQIGDENFLYREVDWVESMEKAANLAANKGAGAFWMPDVAEWIDELKAVDFDLDLTMFDETERAALHIETPEPDSGKEKDHDISEGYRILIECRDEEHQIELIGQLQEQGVECKPLIS